MKLGWGERRWDGETNGSASSSSHVQRRLHAWSRYSTLYVLSCTEETLHMIQVQYTLCTLVYRGDLTHDPGTLHFMYSRVQRRLHTWSRYSTLYVLFCTGETSHMIQVQYTLCTLMYIGDFTHDSGTVHFMYRGDFTHDTDYSPPTPTLLKLKSTHYFQLCFLSKVPFPGEGNE